MQTGNSARRFVSLGVALIALVALTVSLGTGAASAGPGHAVTAKKKCKKKKKHHSASSAKKKKCKKVHHIVLPAPAPLVRATLAWGTGPEVDLHAFDPSGNHAGWDFGVNGVVNNIPSAHHNGDIGPSGGTESFTDDIYVLGGPANREFSYVACLYDGPSPSDYTATFTGVSKGGTTTTLTLDGTPSNGPDVYTVSVPGGPAVPNPAAVCDV
jgi:hypothetical protein